MSELLELFREITPHKILFLMLLITVAVTVAAKILEVKFKNDKKMDIEKIFEASRRLDCSEYDIFCRTGRAWNIPEASVKEDFKRYLLSGELPITSGTTCVPTGRRSRRKTPETETSPAVSPGPLSLRGFSKGPSALFYWRGPGSGTARTPSWPLPHARLLQEAGPGWRGSGGFPGRA